MPRALLVFNRPRSPLFSYSAQNWSNTGSKTLDVFVDCTYRLSSDHFVALFLLFRRYNATGYKFLLLFGPFQSRVQSTFSQTKVKMRWVTFWVSTTQDKVVYRFSLPIFEWWTKEDVSVVSCQEKDEHRRHGSHVLVHLIICQLSVQNQLKGHNQTNPPGRLPWGVQNAYANVSSTSHSHMPVSTMMTYIWG